MGLLDDAIREHLELKRSRGSDPGEVARKEREALGPAEQEGEPAAQVYAEPEESAAAGSSEPADEPHPVQPYPTFPAGQETVELDMDSVLQEHREPEVAERASGDEPDAGYRSRRDLPAEDSLEWETPSEGVDREQLGDIDDSGESEEVDDVLEETPDFLRDTPEQERLWFEQRPPRDFDFDD